MMDADELLSPRIWQIVAAIPEGCVASYGQIARMAGLPGYARYVGRVLRSLPIDTRLPWHRVVRADGRLALASGSETAIQQAALLLTEGVVVNNGRVAMKLVAWRP